MSTEEIKTDPNAASSMSFSEEKMMGAPTWAKELGDRMLGIHELVVEVRNEVKATNSRLDRTVEEQRKNHDEVVRLGERVSLIEERLTKLELERIEPERLLTAAD